MGRAIKEKTLMRKMMTHLTICLVVILALATPILYYLTTSFYAEDLIRIVEESHLPKPHLDLEADVMQGMGIQIVVILIVIALAVMLVMLYVTPQLWRPFRGTLQKVGDFSLERGVVPTFTNCGISEFDQLNAKLSHLMQDAMHSYQVQKEFTANASHELQTPLAVIEGQLEILYQDPDLTPTQAETIGSMEREIKQMSQLSRNLLLLARIDSRQYACHDKASLSKITRETVATLREISGDTRIRCDFNDVAAADHIITCNASLLSCLVRNLLVNALRHSPDDAAGSEIIISVSSGGFSVSNPASHDAGPLDAQHIFDRFYRSTGDGARGYGLGLAIARSICEYHGWTISYKFSDGRHIFNVAF